MAKGRIQAFIAALAEAEDIHPAHLVFKWTELKEMTMPKHGIMLNDKVHSVRIHLGRNSQVLISTDSEMQKSDRAPKVFLSTNKNEIPTALRKLKRRRSRGPVPGEARK